MPALLHEDLRIFPHIRIEYSIEINIHEILEVLIVTARHRVHRLIWIGHRIEERIERSLDELDKRFLERIFAAATERRMLHNMRYARIIYRRRAERNRKNFIVIVILQKKQLRTALLMLEEPSRRIRLRNDTLTYNFKSMYYVFYVQQKASLINIIYLLYHRTFLQ